jgi:hypothetical protein
MISGNLVLIHGFWSSTSTWKELKECFNNDPELSAVRVYPFPYESPKLPRLPLLPVRIPDYDDIAQSLATELPVKVPDGDVVIVTHSQGGLILQRFLAWMLTEEKGEELARIRLIVMLACPNEGSEYLRSFRAAAGFGRHPQGRELKTLNSDATVARRIVHKRIINAKECSAHECKIPIYAYAGRTDNVVRRTSAQSDFPEVGSLPGDHSSILDPNAPGNITFPALKKHLLAAFTGSAAQVMADEPLPVADGEGGASPQTAGAATGPDHPMPADKPETYRTAMLDTGGSHAGGRGMAKADPLARAAITDASVIVPATHTLRIIDRVAGNRHEITVSWRRLESARREASTTLTYLVDRDDEERIRWYLENYLEYPADPAPRIAAVAETRLSEIGRELFANTFKTQDMAAIWADVTSKSGGLTSLRIEVDADPTDVPGIPWEILREPSTDRPAALAVKEFVRVHHQTARQIRMPEPIAGQLRVLFAICRPGGAADVPFRSVASRLIRGGAERMHGLDLDVLRPPTYGRLAHVLRAAADAGRPYGVVHFDGHGTYLDADELAREDLSTAGEIRPGRHGYLLFEDSAAPHNIRLVDGSTVAALLAETGVSVLVMNACRTAYADAPDSRAQEKDEAPTALIAIEAQPGAADETPQDGVLIAADAAGDVHAWVRAFGSLAAEVADAGVPGVVAMRYNVYVVTAAQFAADLYAHLLQGKTLGHAVTSARKALDDDPVRQIGPWAFRLQDWTVPVVYEAQPLTLVVPGSVRQQMLKISSEGNRSDNAPAGHRSSRAMGLPRPPDLGFFGRDDAILALDRAFDTDRLVLLHADAGAGKSAVAAEFARWYQATGGLDYADHSTGLVICTSFARHTSLAGVLEVAGKYLTGFPEAGQVNWPTVQDADICRDIILGILLQVPVVWMWDDIQQVAGFPIGTPSGWSGPEQDELADFLRDIKDHTRAQMLLVSRYGEQAWLGNLPMHVALPPMPMWESVQLAHALAARRGGIYANAAAGGIDWRPLLSYARGNPLRITALVANALSEGLTTTEQIAEFTERIRTEEALERPLLRAEEPPERPLLIVEEPPERSP